MNGQRYFSLVPYNLLHTALPAVIPHLMKDVDLSNGCSGADDLLRDLFNQQATLWVGVDNGQIVAGHVLTYIRQYAQKKMLALQFCAAERGLLSDFGDLAFETLERYAREQGCAGIEFGGRRGWTPTAAKHGFTEQKVVFQKFFEV